MEYQLASYRDWNVTKLFSYVLNVNNLSPNRLEPHETTMDDWNNSKASMDVRNDVS